MAKICVKCGGEIVKAIDYNYYVVYKGGKKVQEGYVHKGCKVKPIPQSIIMIDNLEGVR